MSRIFDTNFILNDVYDNSDGTVRLRRFDSNYIFNAIYDPTQPGLRVRDIYGLMGDMIDLQSSGFTKNLTSGVTNVQLLADAVDQLTISSQDTYTTGATLNNKIVTFERNDGQNYNVDLTSLSNTFTYSALTLTQVDWTLNTGTTFYEQSLVVGGLVTDSTTEVFFNGGDRDSYNEYIDCQVLQLSSTTNSITFEAVVEPLVDINFKLRW